jgi:hypothetical protein
VERKASWPSPLGRWLAVAVVLATYVFFATRGKWDLKLQREPSPRDYYSLLAEGFRQGSLALAATPDPRLAALPDPYDKTARYDVSALWDATYYQGKYYLYFSAVPALLVYLPVRLVSGHYPSAPLVCLIFIALQSLFLIAALDTALAARPTRPRRGLHVLLLGLGGVIPFVLANARHYEVAIACGSAMSAGWAFALARYARARRTRDAVLVGLFIAGALACRPQLALLGVASLLVLPVRTSLAQATRHALVMALPALAAVAALAWYNAARFGSPWEFGLAYQITEVDQGKARMFRAGSVADLAALLNNLTQYLAWTPVPRPAFPFVALRLNQMDGAAYPGWPEVVGGVLPLLPHVVLAAGLALWDRGDASDEERALLRAFAGAGVALLVFLGFFWSVIARYELDFAGLLSLAALLFLESRLAVGAVRRQVGILWACSLFSVGAAVLCGFTDLFGKVWMP